MRSDVKIFDFVVDASKANAELKKLEQAYKDTKYANALAKAEGNEYATSLLHQKRAIDEAKEAQHRATSALRGHEAQSKNATSAMGKLKDVFEKTTGISAKTALGIGAVSGALGLIGKTLGSIIEQGKKYSDDVGALGPRVEALCAATDGMFSDSSLARLINHADKMKLSEEQTKLLTLAAVDHARMTNDEFNPTLEKLTDALANGSTKAFKILGIEVKKGSTLAETQARILAALTEKTQGVARASENAAEKQDSYNNAMERSKGKMGAALVESESYKKGVEATTKAIAAFTLGVGYAARAVVFLSEKLGNAAYAMTHGELVSTMQRRTDTLKKSLKEETDYWNNREKEQNKYLGKDKDFYLNTDILLEESEKKKAKLNAGAKAYQTSHTVSRPKIKYDDTFEKAIKANAERDKKAHEKITKDYALRQDRYNKTELANLKKQEQSKLKVKNDSAKKAADIERERINVEKQCNEERIGFLTDFTFATLQSTFASIAAGDSASDVARKTAKAALDGITQMAWGQAMAATAFALAAQGPTLGVPNPSSLSYWASAALWTVLAGGLTVASGALDSSGGGGSSGSDSRYESRSSGSSGSSGSSSSSTGSSGSAKGNSPVVNNIYVGRASVLPPTRKETIQMFRKAQRGVR